MVPEVILEVLGVIVVVLGVVLAVLHGAQRHCSEQMFGTDSVRNNGPSPRRAPTDPIFCAMKATIVDYILAPFRMFWGWFRRV